jgi:hypothetical protein
VPRSFRNTNEPASLHMLEIDNGGGAPSQVITTSATDDGGAKRRIMGTTQAVNYHVGASVVSDIKQSWQVLSSVAT